jgi:hypothetical protein
MRDPVNGERSVWFQAGHAGKRVMEAHNVAPRSFPNARHNEHVVDAVVIKVTKANNAEINPPPLVK